jgi:hypothetical protein
MTDAEDEEMYRRWKEDEGYDSYERAYHEKMEHDLMAFGFTRDTVDEVFGLLGGYGLEALFDVL